MTYFQEVAPQLRMKNSKSLVNGKDVEKHWIFSVNENFLSYS